MSDTQKLERTVFEEMMGEGVELSDINYALAHRKNNRAILASPRGSVFVLFIQEREEGGPYITTWKTAFA